MEPTSPRWWPFSADPRHRARRIRLWIFGIVIVLGVNWWFVHRATEGPSRLRVPYSPFFIDAVRADHVREITSRGTTIQGTFNRPLRYRGSKPLGRFKTEIPAFADGSALTRLLQQHRVIVNAQSLDTALPWWKSLLFGFGPTILVLGLLYWVFRRSRAGGMLGGLGRAKPRRFDPTADVVRFADVAGIDEAKTELAEIVDFLRSPDKYRRLGGRIPRGVLLSGAPGTGKTLLARAVAGEAGVPFFSLSASEFVEAIAGLGASRVRDLFAQAKKVAPAIVFIDELDAIGRTRSAHGGFGASSDEREQTLNQILTEMDGFEGDTSVIVMAATNRADILDTALLRPGRFDRRVAVQAPDRDGREKILEVHTRGVPLDENVDIGRLAASTPGMVGADLANLVNEAALLAARRNHQKVTTADLTDALERVVLGAERQIVMSDDDRRRTAYHEAGHALVGMLSRGTDPVRKVSIIPRGGALGVTLSTPDADRFNYTEDELRARIVLAFGGRAAEDIIFGDRTTGAESDIRQATEIARRMVASWGMNGEVGMVALAQDDERAAGAAGNWPHSDRTRELVDAEVRRLIAASYERAYDLLVRNRASLEGLVEALLEHETLDQEAAYAAAGVDRRNVERA